MLLEAAIGAQKFEFKSADEEQEDYGPVAHDATSHPLEDPLIRPISRARTLFRSATQPPAAGPGS